MYWNKKQIKQHKFAAKALNKIIFEVAKFLKNNPSTTDVDVKKFIAKQYKINNLVSDKHKSIVSFNKDTANVHFYAERPRKIKNGDLIMIDIWAKLNERSAPFADITWMMYCGRKLSGRYIDAFKIVAVARNKAIKYLQNSLKNKTVPIGKEVDAVARIYLEKCGYGDNFLHNTGHSLGSVGPHGRKTRISKNGRQQLPLNVGYTIEPGIYFNGKFGVRSEINFYIDENYKLIITTICQKQIIKI